MFVRVYDEFIRPGEHYVDLAINLGLNLQNIVIERYPGPEDFGLKLRLSSLSQSTSTSEIKFRWFFCRKIGPGLPKVPRQHQIDLLYWLHHRSIALATMLQEPRPVLTRSGKYRDNQMIAFLERIRYCL